MDSADDGERLLTTFTPDRSVMLEWTAIASMSFFVALFALGWLYVAVTGADGSSVGGGDLGGGSAALWLVVTALLVVAVIVLHELVHGAVIRYFGGDVSYGFGLAGFVMPYAYTTTTHRLSRGQFVVVALAPLVAITTVGFAVLVAVETPWLLVPLAFNVSGAIGDVWMTGILLRYPRHVVVEDDATGLRIYGREGDRPLPSTGARRFLRRLLFGTGVVFLVFLVLAILGPVLLASAGVESFVVGPPGTPWSVVAFETTPDGGFRYEANPAGVLGVSLLVGVLLALVSVPWRPDPIDVGR